MRKGVNELPKGSCPDADGPQARSQKGHVNPELGTPATAAALTWPPRGLVKSQAGRTGGLIRPFGARGSPSRPGEAFPLKRRSPAAIDGAG
jgi:hypothetical protein